MLLNVSHGKSINVNFKRNFKTGKNKQSVQMVKKVLEKLSCDSLKMGEFHGMDRARGPACIRFILQRTFMLVGKTRLSVFRDNFIESFVPFNARM